MKTVACFVHDHELRETDLSGAHEIGRKRYDGERDYRPELSVWVWWHRNGKCYGYGSEPNTINKEYMEE